MHVEKMLSKFVDQVCPQTHKTRKKAVCALLSSSLRHECMGVTSLGRGIAGTVLEKHKIKRADRLLSNQRFQEELEGIYKHLTHLLVDSSKKVVVLIDWSNLDPGQRHFLLRASVALEGRSITLFEQVHTNETKEKLVTHRAFLAKLKELLPPECTPIIVTDAGFRITWFKEVESLGWHWVGRIRGNVTVRLQADSDWLPTQALHTRASSTAKELGAASLGKRSKLDCRAVIYKAKHKARVLNNKKGTPKRVMRARKAQKANGEPWVLATSLPSSHYTASKIVKLYSFRMQIEESFRDTKSTQYGVGFAQARTYKIERLKVLITLATLVTSFAWLLGKMTQLSGLHRTFQANTIKSKTVLSHVFVGTKVFKHKRFVFYFHQFIDAIINAQKMVLQNAS